MRVDTAVDSGGVTRLVVDNGLVEVVVMPQLGGKIWQITDRRSGTELLWHHPDLAPRPVPIVAVYDDVFFGGWDVLFPNDEPEALAGRRLPDHGEVWSKPWEWEIERDNEDEVGLHLWLETTEYPCRLDTWLRLGAGERRIRLQYRLVNLGGEDLPYLWKLHVAVALPTGARVDLGAETMYVEDFGPTRTGLTAGSYSWPIWEGPDGEPHDMRRVPPRSSGLAELQYATTMQAGWCAVTRPDPAVGLGLTFDLAIFPSCWTFASYGGWQDLHVLVLEPCTGYPLSVAAGARTGTHRTLAAGETIETEVVAVVIEEMREVAPA